MTDKEISPENNWGDVIGALQSMKSAPSFGWEVMLAEWTTRDLKPIVDDPVGQSQYLKDLLSEDEDVRLRATETAARFREESRRVVHFIFGTDLSGEEKDMLVFACERGANGVLTSLLSDVDDPEILVGIELNNRLLFAEFLLGVNSRLNF